MYKIYWAMGALAAFVSACDVGPEAAPGGGRTLAVAMAAPEASCEVMAAGIPLPEEVRETSGLARSLRDPDLFWTHNDAGNEPVVFGVGADGRLAQRVRVTGAGHVDWEDLETAPCGDGSCLFVGDIGDNDGERQAITVYRVAEPAAGARDSPPAEPLHARFPDGPRDAEALFVGSGALYVVTKGRSEAIALYRYPPPQRPGETVTLERVRELFPAAGEEADRVTAATSTPDGRWVGIRTYRALYIYPMDALVGGAALEPAVVDLSPLAEAQGEAVAMADDGTVWLSSEAAGKDQPPTWSRLRCRLPDR